MKNKNLYSICFCMALAGSLQTTYGQVDAEGVADSTLSPQEEKLIRFRCSAEGNE